MTNCNSTMKLGNLHGKDILADFDGGVVGSDGGLMLLRKADEQLGLTEALADAITDDRDPDRIEFALQELVMQRVYQIACGYEDCNDANALHSDPILKTAIDRAPKTDGRLPSQPTGSRFENSVDAKDLRRMADVILDAFVASHSKSEPQQIVLDFDATVDPTHGGQQLTLFDGYYDTYCYLPLIVTAEVDGDDQQLLTTVLRPGASHDSHGALAVLKRIVARIRYAWPQVDIIFRADSGFAIPDIYRWCEANDVDYLIGLITNSRLLKLAEPYVQAAEAQYAETECKVRNLHEGRYAAGSWQHDRRVVIKAEHNHKGKNTRFVVTNITDGGAEQLYDRYAERGESENRIKELKNDLQIDRTSCHAFLANQFRLFLHATAFILFNFLRKLLWGTQWAKARVCRLQRDLIKLGVRVKENSRTIWLHFASNCPVAHLWPKIIDRLKARA